MERCPICRADVAALWRMQGSDELPVCKCCNEIREGCRELVHERIHDALKHRDLDAEQRAERMRLDFFATDGTD